METIKKLKISLKPIGGKSVDIDKLCIVLVNPLSEEDVKSLIGVFKKGGYKLNMAVKYRSKDFLKMFNENSTHARIFMGALAMLADEHGRKIFKIADSAGLTMISWSGLDIATALPISADEVVEDNEEVDETAGAADEVVEEAAKEEEAAADEVVEEAAKEEEAAAEEVKEEVKEEVVEEAAADEVVEEAAADEVVEEAAADEVVEEAAKEEKKTAKKATKKSTSKKK